MLKNRELLTAVAAFAGEHRIASIVINFADDTAAELWQDDNGVLQTADVTPIPECGDTMPTRCPDCGKESGQGLFRSCLTCKACDMLAKIM